MVFRLTISAGCTPPRDEQDHPTPRLGTRWADDGQPSSKVRGEATDGPIRLYGDVPSSDGHSIVPDGAATLCRLPGELIDDHTTRMDIDKCLPLNGYVTDGLL